MVSNDKKPPPAAGIDQSSTSGGLLSGIDAWVRSFWNVSRDSEGTRVVHSGKYVLHDGLVVALPGTEVEARGGFVEARGATVRATGNAKVSATEGTTVFATDNAIVTKAENANLTLQGKSHAVVYGDGPNATSRASEQSSVVLYNGRLESATDSVSIEARAASRILSATDNTKLALYDWSEATIGGNAYAIARGGSKVFALTGRPTIEAWDGAHVHAGANSRVVFREGSPAAKLRLDGMATAEISDFRGEVVLRDGASLVEKGYDYGNGGVIHLYDRGQVKLDPKSTTRVVSHKESGSVSPTHLDEILARMRIEATGRQDLRLAGSTEAVLEEGFWGTVVATEHSTIVAKGSGVIQITGEGTVYVEPSFTGSIEASGRVWVHAKNSDGRIVLKQNAQMVHNGKGGKFAAYDNAKILKASGEADIVAFNDARVAVGDRVRLTLHDKATATGGGDSVISRAATSTGIIDADGNCRVSADNADGVVVHENAQIVKVVNGAALRVPIVPKESEVTKRLDHLEQKLYELAEADWQKLYPERVSPERGDPVAWQKWQSQFDTCLRAAFDEMLSTETLTDAEFNHIREHLDERILRRRFGLPEKRPSLRAGITESSDEVVVRGATVTWQRLYEPENSWTMKAVFDRGHPRSESAAAQKHTVTSERLDRSANGIKSQELTSSDVLAVLQSHIESIEKDHATRTSRVSESEVKKLETLRAARLALAESPELPATIRGSAEKTFGGETLGTAIGVGIVVSAVLSWYARTKAGTTIAPSPKLPAFDS